MRGLVDGQPGGVPVTHAHVVAEHGEFHAIVAVKNGQTGVWKRVSRLPGAHQVDAVSRNAAHAIVILGTGVVYGADQGAPPGGGIHEYRGGVPVVAAGGGYDHVGHVGSLVAEGIGGLVFKDTTLPKIGFREHGRHIGAGMCCAPAREYVGTQDGLRILPFAGGPYHKAGRHADGQVVVRKVVVKLL